MTKEDIIKNSRIEKAPDSDSCIVIEWEGDVNDGDYINDESHISIKEFETALPILKKIGYKKGHNWGEDKSEYLLDDEIDLIYEVLEVSLRYGDYEAHTVSFNVTFKDDGKTYEVNWKNML